MFSTQAGIFCKHLNLIHMFQNALNPGEMTNYAILISFFLNYEVIIVSKRELKTWALYLWMKTFYNFLFLAKHEGFLIEGASLFWRSVSNNDSGFFIYKILRQWWRECDLERSKSRLPAFYVQLSALNCGRQSLLNKGIAENVSTFSAPCFSLKCYI